MATKKFPLLHMTFIALSLELLTTLSFPRSVQAQSLNQKELNREEVSTSPTHLLRSDGKIASNSPSGEMQFIAPNVGTPRRREAAAVREGGATEQGSCSNSTDGQPVALLPPTAPALTVAEYPTVFVSLPQTSAKEGEFVLVSGSKNGVLYKTTVTLPSHSGIVSVSLPKQGTLPPLEIGKSYSWYFFVVCNPQQRANDLVAQGEIQRVEPSPSLTAKLKNASPRDRASLYAKAGIWYDALDTIAELHRSSPNDRAIAADWTELLKSVGLDTISQKPLLP